MEILKFFAVCIVTALICVLFRQQRPEFSVLISLIATVGALIFFLTKISEPISMILDKLNGYGIELSYFKIALKALGIGYVTNFCSNICKDAGQASLSSIAETIGKGSIFILSVPLILNIIDLALGFIK